VGAPFITFQQTWRVRLADILRLSDDVRVKNRLARTHTPSKQFYHKHVHKSNAAGIVTTLIAP
jgi:hypothetical protein